MGLLPDRGAGRAGRGFLAGALSLLLVGSVACATNPVTGESELALIGEEQEIAMGREADQQVVASMGVVQDEELRSYVSELGSELAAVSERPDLPWTFRVIDDPTVNAFALPGGFIYVTRGMLAHLDSEAQLAGILGHEIGHVTARHSVNQMSRQQLASLGLGLGMALLPELRDFGDLAGAGMQLLFLKFGRDDERQSDALGVRYMTALDYEPAELSTVFAMLERMSDETGGTLPTWASTHPAPQDRQRSILAMADTLPGATRVARPAFLHQVDGLVFGQNPRHGFFQDGTFHHPELAFRLDVPRGWEGVNGARAVQLASPEQNAAVVLRTAQASTPAMALESFMAQDGVRLQEGWEEAVNGLPAAWADFTVETERGRLAGRAVFPMLDGQVYLVYGFSGADAWASHRPTVDGVLSSFRRETDPTVLDVQPEMLGLVSLDQAMDVATFMDRYGVSVDAATVTLINQVWDTNRLPAGLVKRVTAG